MEARREEGGGRRDEGREISFYRDAVVVPSPPIPNDLRGPHTHRSDHRRNSKLQLQELQPQTRARTAQARATPDEQNVLLAVAAARNRRYQDGDAKEITQIVLEQQGMFDLQISTHV